MKCSLLTLSCALDGELSRERQADLDAHLVTCDRCRTGMRYLREEAERIAQLVQVTLPQETATALLERSRVLNPNAKGGSVAVAPPAALASASPTSGVASAFLKDSFPSPTEPTIAPAPPSPSPLPEPEDSMVAPEVDPPSAAETTVPADPEPAAALEGSFESSPEDPEDEDISASLLLSPEFAASAFEEQGEQEPSQTAPAPEAEDYAQPVEPIATEPEEAQELADAPEEPPEPPTALIPATPTAITASAPDLPPPAEVEGAAKAEAFASEVPAEAEPPEDQAPSGVPEGDVAGADASAAAAFEGGVAMSGAEEPGWEPDPQPGAVPEPADSVLPYEEAASASEISAAQTSVPPRGAGRTDEPARPFGLKAGSDAIAPWQPSADLNIPWAEESWLDPGKTGDAQGLPAAPPPPSAFATPPTSRPIGFTPRRPAESVSPEIGRSRAVRSEGQTTAPPRRAPGERRTAPPPRTPRPRPAAAGQQRDWTRIGTVAVGALAVILILFGVLHHGGSTPAASTHPKATPSASSGKGAIKKPAATPAAAPTPIPLTGVGTMGSSGSGYQVQSIRYGVHPGPSYWVVFQLVSGSGSPKVTWGFDGPQKLYVEMSGVSAGTAVAQPPSGNLVTSVTPTTMPGFTGAVYLLQLSQSAQVQGYLVPGNGTGGSGDRVLLEVQ